MSDRHEKWIPVSPGTVIPAGQPYRIEYAAVELIAAREHRGDVREWTVGAPGAEGRSVFVDSSWVPPLVLPTEPTWGIVLEESTDRHHAVGEWVVFGEELQATSGAWVKRVHISDFIPLTDEQVARIEAHR